MAAYPELIPAIFAAFDEDRVVDRFDHKARKKPLVQGDGDDREVLEQVDLAFGQHDPVSAQILIRMGREGKGRREGDEAEPCAASGLENAKAARLLRSSQRAKLRKCVASPRQFSTIER